MHTIADHRAYHYVRRDMRKGRSKGKLTLSWRLEPVEVVHQYEEPQLSQGLCFTERHRYWMVDMDRKGLEPTAKFGIQAVDVDNVVRVCAVSSEAGTAIAKWNESCRQTFPADQIRAYDYIIKVNGIQDDAMKMMQELRRFGRGELEDVTFVACREED